MGDGDWRDVPTLTNQERMVLRLRFGSQHTLSETGALAGGQLGQSVTRRRVRQIEEHGLRKLRDAGYVACFGPKLGWRFTHGRADDAVAYIDDRGRVMDVEEP